MEDIAFFVHIIGDVFQCFLEVFDPKSCSTHAKFMCLLVVIIQGNLDRYSGKFGTRRSGVRRGSGGSVPGRLFGGSD